MTKGRKQAPEHVAKRAASIRASWYDSPSRAAQAGVARSFEARILAALPGTVSDVVKRTGLPRTYVGGKLRRLAEKGELDTRRIRQNREGNLSVEYRKAER